MAGITKKVLRKCGIEIVGYDRISRRPVANLKGDFVQTAERWLHSYVSKAQKEVGISPVSLAGIIFSKDRALQLHALMRSYFDQIKDPVPLYVIYTGSSDAHCQAYEELFREFKELPVHAIKEQTLRGDLIQLLNDLTVEKVFFLVDDIMFVRPASLKPLAHFEPSMFIPSLRMGRQLSHSFMFGVLNHRDTIEMPLPKFYEVPESSLLFWRYSEGIAEWGYPVSLDGHIFSRREFLVMIEPLAFKSPTSLESEVARLEPLMVHRFGVCFPESIIVNNPCNRVQSDYQNPHSGELDSEQMLGLWKEGKRIKVSEYYGKSYAHVHERMPVYLEAAH